MDHVIGEILEGKSRLVVGFTWQKVQAEVKRMVGNRVRVLHALAETAAVRNEAELGEEELKALADRVDERESGAEVVSEREKVQERTKLVEAHLAGEGELLALFRCLREGIRSPAGIGLRLGVAEGEVGKLRKRLERRLEKLKRELAQAA